MISSDDLLFLEITLNLVQKLVLNTMILGLQIRISHRNFFLLVMYCMFDSLTTHKIPNFMTRFGHANYMTSLRGHCTPLVLDNVIGELTVCFSAENRFLISSALFGTTKRCQKKN